MRSPRSGRRSGASWNERRRTLARNVTASRSMTDPQKQADRVRELVSEADAVRRLGIEVLRAVGTDTGVTLRARRDTRTFTAECGRGWMEEAPQRLADTLSRDLVADALSPPPPLAAGGPRWGRAADRAHRRPGPSH